jgi:OHCU decarboxylase
VTNQTLAAWNIAEELAALDAMLACCGARRWAEAMVAMRPIARVEDLSVAADEAWSTMEEADWMEAFECHPRIGERAIPHANARSASWSQEEQSSASGAATAVLDELAKGNQLYEKQFGFSYIVCATGKSAEEMLMILKRRLGNDRESELRAAAEQQRQIMQIRLGKWLVE